MSGRFAIDPIVTLDLIEQMATVFGILTILVVNDDTFAGGSDIADPLETIIGFERFQRITRFGDLQGLLDDAVKV